MKINNIQESLIRTLCYSDVFDYPLDFKKIETFYLGRQFCTKKELRQNLRQMVERAMIYKRGSYYALLGREKNIKTFLSRNKESERKLRLARKAARLLEKIPTIKLVAISGSLALNNCKKNDDIDFFIITCRNTLWITRFLVNFLLFINGNRRSRDDIYSVDKICPNMFLTETSMQTRKSRQNIFTAHEIVQIKVLVNKNNTYKKFLNENLWVGKYLPNFPLLPKFNIKQEVSSDLEKYIDNVFFTLQFLYMSGRITHEEVTKNIARFHPNDKTEAIIKLYKLRVKSYMEFLKLNLRKRKKTIPFEVPDTPGY